MKKLSINLGLNSYAIIIEDDLLFHLSFYIEQIYHNDKIFIITDDVVAKYYLDTVIEGLKFRYDVETIVFPNGEASKNIDNYVYLVKELLNKNIRRNHLLLALGGGVVGDITGFVAATLYRGLPYVNVPTTLLSQMDSSIGGKTGIDFAGRKNIIGAFKQPKLVLIDPRVLNTLSQREFNNGMGELIKHAAIGNKELFNKLKSKPLIDENIIFESLTVKKQVVEKDEFDVNERMLLNFGHTFGHVIELKYNYKHGEAVAMGMLMAIKLGIDLGVTKKTCYEDILAIIKAYDLPCEAFDYKAYLASAINDKKNLAGKLNFILLEEIGKAIIYPIEESKLKELL